MKKHQNTLKDAATRIEKRSLLLTPFSATMRVAKYAEYAKHLGVQQGELKLWLSPPSIREDMLFRLNSRNFLAPPVTSGFRVRERPEVSEEKTQSSLKNI